MDIHVTFHQMNVSPQIEAYCQEKFGKLIKFNSRIQDMRVVLEVKKLDHKVGVVAHLPQKVTVKAETVSKDMYASIDAAYDKLERQLTSHKEQQ